MSYALPAAMTPAPAPRIPRHVAIIMDGNGRWARQRGRPRTAGHRAGVKSVRAVVAESVRRGVEALTLFAFSSENWQRPRTEVNLLMELFLTALRSEIGKLHQEGVRFRLIGERGAFPQRLQRQVDAAESLTRNNMRLHLQVAANYGGRWDVVQAARQLAGEVAAGRLEPEEIDERLLGERLSFPDLPEPDLFIRTGGEQRLSNFLLWQSAYAELHFSPVLWPDFAEREYGEALDDYASRQRRFGMISEQIEADELTGHDMAAAQVVGSDARG